MDSRDGFAERPFMGRKIQLCGIFCWRCRSPLMAIRCPGNEKGEIQLESPDSGVVCSIFVTALPIEGNAVRSSPGYAVSSGESLENP